MAGSATRSPSCRRGAARRWICPTLLLALYLLTPPAAGAGEPLEFAGTVRPGVALDIAGCPDLNGAAVQRVLAAELNAAVTADGAQAASADTTRVVVRCAPTGLVSMRVVDPVTGKSLERRADLGTEDAAARPRLLALAVAELIAASWIELTTRPRTQVRLPEATASPETRELALAVARKQAETRFVPGWTIEGLGTARVFHGGSLALFGGGLAITRLQREWFAFSADAVVEGGTEQVSLGSVNTLFGSVAGHALLRRRLGRLSVESGIGARVAAGRIAGDPAGASVTAEGSRFFSWWGGPLLTARLRVRLWRRLALSVGAETGLATREIWVLVGGNPEIAIDGVWFAGGVALGLAP